VKSDVESRGQPCLQSADEALPPSGTSQVLKTVLREPYSRTQDRRVGLPAGDFAAAAAKLVRVVQVNPAAEPDRLAAA